MTTSLLRTICAIALLATGVAAAAPTPQTQREIDWLIAGLGASGCRFERNGSWYDAKKAQAHLQQKYDYLRKRGMADTAELFIERAATESSMSGKPYHVQCAGRAVEPSAEWFKRRLHTLRTSTIVH